MQTGASVICVAANDTPQELMERFAELGLFCVKGDYKFTSFMGDNGLASLVQKSAFNRKNTKPFVVELQRLTLNLLRPNKAIVKGFLSGKQRLPKRFLELTAWQASCLSLFSRHQIVGKRFVHAQCSPRGCLETMRVHIHKLNEELTGSKFPPVETVFGVGYKWPDVSVEIVEGLPVEFSQDISSRPLEITVLRDGDKSVSAYAWVNEAKMFLSEQQTHRIEAIYEKDKKFFEETPYAVRSVVSTINKKMRDKVGRELILRVRGWGYRFAMNVNLTRRDQPKKDYPVLPTLDF